MRKMIVAVLGIVLLATSGLAMAQGWGRGSGMGPGMGYGPCMQGYGQPGPGAMAPGLNLTAEQNQKISALQENSFKETVPLRNELTAKQLELRSLWAQTTPDEEKILAKQKEINALRAQLQEKSTKNRLEMRKVLTPEQQAQFNALGGGPGYGPGLGFGKRGGCGGPRGGRGMGW
jgi:zinc resistance-associated protein